MKKKYYGILLAAVIAAGTIGVTAQAAELADTEKLTETANVTDRCKYSKQHRCFCTGTE